MADGSVTEGFGKVVLGGAVGFGLYLLITGLGFGGVGRGDGRGERGERTDVPSPSPTPPRPRDDQRLSFVMFQPTIVPKPTDDVPKLLRFRLSGSGPGGQSYSLEEMIARVKEGGRSDVALGATGGVIHGPWETAKDLVKRAGLEVWLFDTSTPASPSSPPAVSGNARGQYGRAVGRGVYR